MLFAVSISFSSFYRVVVAGYMLSPFFATCSCKLYIYSWQTLKVLMPSYIKEFSLLSMQFVLICLRLLAAAYHWLYSNLLKLGDNIQLTSWHFLFSQSISDNCLTARKHAISFSVPLLLLTLLRSIRIPLSPHVSNWHLIPSCKQLYLFHTIAVSSCSSCW